MRRYRGGPGLAENRTKTARRSQYSAGTTVKSGGSACEKQDTETAGKAAPRHDTWQDWLQAKIDLLTQSIWGLCLSNQGCPKTNGTLGESMINSSISSRWLPERERLTKGVTWVMVARGRPPNDHAVIGLARGMVEMFHLRAVAESRKFPSAPESRRAWTVCEPSWKESRKGSWVRVAGEFVQGEGPTRTLHFTGGPWLLTDTEGRSGQPCHSTNTSPFAGTAREKSENECHFCFFGAITSRLQWKHQRTLGEKGLARIWVAIINWGIVGMRFGFQRNASTEGVTTVSRLPLQIIEPHEELRDSGIKSVLLMRCGVELGGMLTQQCSLLHESRAKRIRSRWIHRGQTVLSGRRGRFQMRVQRRFYWTAN